MHFMKYFCIACLFIGVFSLHCQGQLSVNADWRERNGLTVASSQMVVVPATKLRLFTTLASIADEPQAAIRHLASDKESISKVMAEMGVTRDTFSFTSPRIIEWERTPENRLYGRSGGVGLLLKTDLNSYTAMAHVAMDFFLEEAESAQIVLRAYETCQQLRSHDVFKNCEFIVLFVGEVSEVQITDAKKKAYEEAFSDAQTLASLSGRSLGRLSAITPEIDGRWRFMPGFSYANQLGGITEIDLLAHFAPAENEVFGSDPLKLTRIYTVELRFEID
ncbi:MAG: hypothetical protein KDB03_06320 [Planctomycetales bacterium]|nr:hypothetical protein [Planctomycetales bacterium]